MNYSRIIEQVKQYVIQFFKANGDQNFSYHNLAHTENVVSNSAKIAAHYHLEEKDLFIVLAAAWFHDAGYFSGDPVGHEMRGAEIAATFLKGKNIDADTIQATQDTINATRMPQSPKNLSGQILCDADLFHFGTDDFWDWNKLMRKEAGKRLGKKISKSDWRKSTAVFMEGHEFKTDYCRQILKDKKEQNLKALRQKDTLIEEIKTVVPELVQPSNGHKAETGNSKKQKSNRPERGIETMFRISSTNHQRLSDMADNKAHIMITTTSIIISVLLTVLLRKLEDNPQLIIPTMLLLVVCVVTMVFSILATRPTLPPGTFTKQEIDNRKVNLLFFGNYYRMSFDDYNVGMKQMMEDREFLYGSLTRDLYSQGIVLGRKYLLLRKGYNVFMFGIVSSVVAFIIAAVFFR